MSSFAVIAMVLVASLTIPAKAASWTTLVPADNISDVYYEGNIRNVVYDFDTVPKVQYSSVYANDYGFTAQVDPGTQTLLFRAYPLGAVSTGGPPLSSGASGQIAIDASDFKPSAALTFSSEASFQVDIEQLGTYEQYLDETVKIEYEWSFTGYRSNGGYIAISEPSEKGFFTFRLQDTPDTVVIDLPMTVNLDFSGFPEEVGYFAPVCVIRIHSVYDDPDLVVNSVRFAFDDFTITASTDMLLQESLTLDAIEGQLGDLNNQVGVLNDKADTIISGSPEMNQNAGIASGFAQDQDREANRVEELEKEYLDDFEQSSGVLNDKVTELVDGLGFNQLTALVTPVMNWEHSGLIMLLVIAFINMSVILFGR